MKNQAIEYVKGFTAKKYRYKPSLRKRNELSSSDFLDIISHWQVCKPSIAELGRKFEISRVLAGHIIRDYRKNPGFILKVRAREQIYQERAETVKETVQNIFKQK